MNQTVTMEPYKNILETLENSVNTNPELNKVIYKDKLDIIFKKLKLTLETQKIDDRLFQKLSFLSVTNYEYELYNLKIDFDLLSIIFDYVILKFDDNMIEVSEIVSNLLIKNMEWVK